MFGQQMTSGIGADNVGVADAYGDLSPMGKLKALFGGHGKITGGSGDGSPSLSSAFGSSDSRANSPLGQLMSKLGGAKTPTGKQLGLSNIDAQQGMFAAAQIGEALKTLGSQGAAENRLAQIQAYEGGDLNKLAQRGAGNLDIAGNIAGFMAQQDLRKRRDEERQAIMDLIKSRGGSTARKEAPASAPKVTSIADLRMIGRGEV